VNDNEECIHEAALIRAVMWICALIRAHDVNIEATHFRMVNADGSFDPLILWLKTDLGIFAELGADAVLEEMLPERGLNGGSMMQ